MKNLQYETLSGLTDPVSAVHISRLTSHVFTLHAFTHHVSRFTFQVPPGRSPLAYSGDWLMWFVALTVIAAVAALLSIWLGRYHSAQAKMVWTVVVIFLPIVGPIAWFVLGRQGPRAR